MTASSWRIVFFGTPSFAVPTLKVLLEGPDEVIAVVTQPDRKKGRGQRLILSPVKETVLQYCADASLPFERLCQESVHGSTGSPRTDTGTSEFNCFAARPEAFDSPFALSLSKGERCAHDGPAERRTANCGAIPKERVIPLFQPERVKEESFQEGLRRLDPDLFVVAAYGQILPKSLLGVPRQGAINVHASLLPKYRGAAPIAWAILKGEALTGVTIMKMDEGMDTGDILLQKETPIGAEETAETLHDRLALAGAELLSEAVAKMKKGEISPVRQDPSLATFAPPLRKEDGRIDWRRGAKEIHRQVRALYPWPGAYTSFEGQLLKIFRGEVREGRPGGEPGKVSWVGIDSVEVGTGGGSFLIREVQLEGKKRMNVRDVLAGRPISAGTVFH